MRNRIVEHARGWQPTHLGQPVDLGLLVVVSLATRLLLRGDQQASALLRRVASRRHGRLEEITLVPRPRQVPVEV
jgi:hypothetical protein